MIENSELNEDDSINHKAIWCEGIPKIFLDKVIAKKYFSKFGKVNRFILRPNRLSCTVEYETESEAERAYNEAGTYNDASFNVSYAFNKEAHVQNTEEWVDSDVQAELEAMQTGNSFYGTISNASLRSGIPAVLSQAPKSMSPGRVLKNAALAGKKSDSPKAVVETDSLKIDSNMRNELEGIMRRPVFNAEDKFRVLEARDKLLRLTRVLQTDITKAVRTKGTCPDMCPEKERYMREYQRQVTSFEYSEGNMDNSSKISHRRAIKEYSRSSADQEMPLAHELRPENVLKMTMQYLMSKVMDLCDNPQTSTADWFHFVWDRTRSIRKDITQQELCSLGGVELVEQCARFHIHCAGRLVAEDPSVFDKKINAENLTKCLQSLKYMYQDLRQRNINCPNEAEFRGYIVLLNLADANFLWEIKQLPEHIQTSNEIRHAIAFYNALQNNNYVRFFNLLRSPATSYLDACTLLGYFNKLRIRAIETMMKAFVWRRKVTLLPLNYFTEVLGFEDNETAASFFRHIGLYCDGERVTSGNLNVPDIEFSMDRCFKLIDSKLSTSVGECVCGGPLEPASIFEDHRPQNSFDANGFLIGTASNSNKLGEQSSKQEQVVTREGSTADENIFKIPRPSTQKIPQLPTVEPEFKVPTIFGGTSSKSVAAQDVSTAKIFSIFPSNSEKTFVPISKQPTEQKRNIFGGRSNENVASTSASNIFSTTVKSTGNIFSTAHKPNASLFKENNLKPFENNTFSSAFSVVPNREDIKLQQKERMKELEAEHQKKLLELEVERKKMRELEDLQAKYLAEQKEKEGSERLKQHLEIQQRKEQFERYVQEVTESEIQSMVDEEIANISNNELILIKQLIKFSSDSYESILSENIEEIVTEVLLEEHALESYNKLLMYRYFERWLSYTRKRLRKRYLIANTPIWVTTMTRAETTKEIQHPCQQKNLELMKRYRYGQPCDFRTLLWPGQNEEPVTAIDICDIIANCRSSQYTAHAPLFFKLLLTLPKEMEELPGFESMCNTWLQRHIKVNQTDEESSNASFICEQRKNVALCVRKFSGVEPLNELGKAVTDEVNHADAIICFYSGVNPLKTQTRLLNLLESGEINKRIPLAIIAYNSQNTEKQLEELFALDDLIEQQHLSEYKFFGCSENKNEFSFPVDMTHALQYVYTSHSQAKDTQVLKMESTLNWLESTLGDEMWQTWQMSTVQNPTFAKVCSIPKFVFDLFEEAVNRLELMATEDFTDYIDLPNELRKFSKKLSSPNISLTLPYFPDDWKSRKRQSQISSFLKSLKFNWESILKNVNLYDLECLQVGLLDCATACITNDQEKAFRVGHNAVKALFEELNRLDLLDLEVNDRLLHINYLPIIKCFVFPNITDKLQNQYCKSLPTEVIFRQEALFDYKQKPWWLNYNAVKVDYSLTENATNLSDSLVKNVELDADEIIKKLSNISKKSKKLNILAVQSLKEDFRKLSNKLDRQLEEFQMTQEQGVFDLSYTKTALNDTIDTIDGIDAINTIDTIDTIDTINNDECELSLNEKGDFSSLNTKRKSKYEDIDEDIDKIMCKASRLIRKYDSEERAFCFSRRNKLMEGNSKDCS